MSTFGNCNRCDAQDVEIFVTHYEDGCFCGDCVDHINAEYGHSDCDVNDEPEDQFRDDVEADADVLRSAGMGTDEDYGYYDYDGMDYDFGLDG